MSKNMKNKDEKSLSFAAFLKVMGFLLPLPVYLVFTLWLFPAPNSAFLALGALGCGFIGLALISIAGLYDDLYFGHFFTFASLGLGGVLILVGSVILYTPSIYYKIDEEYVSFYFLIWVALVICGIWYLLFRMSIPKSLKARGISNTAIKKAQKGSKNQWWYEALHKEYDLGWKYGLNKAFTLLYLADLAVHLLLGWWKPVSPVTALASAALSLAIAPMWGAAWGNVPKTGKESSPSAAGLLVGCVFPIAMGVAVLMYFFQI